MISFLLALLLPLDSSNYLHPAVVTVADLNGDGVRDVVVLSRTFKCARAGIANEEDFGGADPWVVALCGATGATLWRFERPDGAPAEVGLIHDLDLDSVADVAIAWVSLDLPEQPNSGPIVVVSGATGEELLSVAPPPDEVAFGRALATQISLVGDSALDLAVGGAGCVYFVDGATMNVSHVLYREADGDVVEAPFEGERSGDDAGLSRRVRDRPGFGWSLTALLDLDSDGVRELLVGDESEVPIQRGATTVWTERRESFSSVLRFSGGRTLALQTQGWAAASLRGGCGVAHGVAASSPDHDVGVFDLDSGEALWMDRFGTGRLRERGSSLAVVTRGLEQFVVSGAAEAGWDCDAGFVVGYSASTGDVVFSLHAAEFDDLAGSVHVGDPRYGVSGFDLDAADDVDGDGAEEFVVVRLSSMTVALIDGASWRPRWIRVLGQ